MAQDTHLQAWKCLIRSTTALPEAGYYEYSYGMAGDVTTMCLASALIACWDETLVGWLDLDFDASITYFFGIRVGRLVTHTLYDNDLSPCESTASWSFSQVESPSDKPVGRGEA